MQGYLEHPTFHFIASDEHAEIKQLVPSKELACLQNKSVNIYYAFTIHEACIQVGQHLLSTYYVPGILLNVGVTLPLKHSCPITHLTIQALMCSVGNSKECKETYSFIELTRLWLIYQMLGKSDPCYKPLLLSLFTRRHLHITDIIVIIKVFSRNGFAFFSL